jgi:uncharacterized repeat protein (TIGR02543 family)
MNSSQSRKPNKLLAILLTIMLLLVMVPTGVSADPVTVVKVIFTFDDGWVDTRTVAYDILEAFNFPATVYVCRDLANLPQFMSTEQIDFLYNEGWDISNHTSNHLAYGTSSEYAATTDLNELYSKYMLNQNWIINNFGPRGVFNVAYPSGGYSNDLINQVIKKIGAMTGRLAEEEGSQPTPLTDSMHFYKIPVYPLESEGDNPVTLAREKIEAAMVTGDTVVFMLHRVLPVAQTPDPYPYLTDVDFTTIVNYVQSQVLANTVDVMTMSEWYYSTACTAETPPPPAVTADDDADTVIGLAAGMEYNLDGAGYVAYDSATFNSIDLSGPHTMLVRQAEALPVPSGQPTILSFTASSGDAKVIFAFLDGWKGQSEDAMPMLQAAGFKGVAYVSGTNIGVSGDVMNLADLTALDMAGWDIANRSYTWTSNTADYILNRDWLISNSFARGATHISYPGNAYNDTLISELTAVDFRTGLTADEGLTVTPVATTVDLFKMKSFDISNADPYYINKAKTAIDEAVLNGYTAVLVFQNVADVPANSYTISTAGLQEIVNYTRTKSDAGLIKNLSIHEWWSLQSQIPYTLTFDSAGGNEVVAITQAFGTAITPPAAPTRTGYTFTGWSPALPPSMPASDLTVTAQWTIDQYTVTFDSAGGSLVTAITQDYGTAITPPAAPTRTGYTFTGWSPALPPSMPASDLTVTAQWTIDQYTVTFDSAGGSLVTALTQDYGTAITPPAAPTRTGYTFTGWSPALPPSMPASDLTVTAQWTPSEITSSTFSANTISGYLAKINAGLTVANLLAGLQPQDQIHIFSGSTEIPTSALVATGLKANLMAGSSIIQSLTIIVTGDVNGDGKITLTDYILMKSHILETSQLAGAFSKAGDINGDSRISLTDYVKMKSHLLDIEKIVAIAY